MEYLVTMTTRVPDGVSEADVTDVRAREAAHTAELAGRGRVLRLWRPPLLPGEWRTLGLFVADGAADLEDVLASMPLRIWRTDEVTALASHPNDPGRDRVALTPGGTEFFTTFAVTVPPETSEAALEEVTALEARRVRELSAQGHLMRLWRLPGDGKNLGHWQVHDAEQLQELLASLPMADWLSVETWPLTAHPNDPLATGTGADHRLRGRSRT
ncbi:muconolactone delta-isomerase [Kribbella antiqua]|uniref:Muconolactone delta-isomerase n=1 Tax=Kribbella antiqua TaxID=2512217 RepID=A0A4R2ICP4_9ACTN|nr:muconolactone Delta-isomerase family protein [Kribbella antiqua]TCO42343.1 muconolactone delta-isomerase [Kribbella antiqua]